jgi:hypothetical protein
MWSAELCAALQSARAREMFYQAWLIQSLHNLLRFFFAHQLRGILAGRGRTGLFGHLGFSHESQSSWSGTTTPGVHLCISAKRPRWPRPALGHDYQPGIVMLVTAYTPGSRTKDSLASAQAENFSSFLLFARTEIASVRLSSLLGRVALAAQAAHSFYC